MQTRTSQSGFSLVELMVALVCTLLVSGAIYGLLSSGQGAFRREPEVADMQQNLRLAMDTISRDVATAGMGSITAAPLAQIFMPNLDNLDLPRPEVGASGKTDELSLMTSRSWCGAEQICNSSSGSTSHIWLTAQTSCAAANDTPIILMGDGTWTIRHVTGVTTDNGGGLCQGTQQADLAFAAETSGGLNVSGGLCTYNGFGSNPLSCNLTYPTAFILNGDVVTYRINLGSDGVPNLERGSARSLAATGIQYQVLARGIDDLQVEYATANDSTAFVAGAPLVVSGNYGTVITQVRITLSGRTTNQPNLTGVTADASGNLAIRSTLTSTVAVRTALLALSRQHITDPSPGPTPFWN